MAFDPRGGRVIADLQAPADRHFYGHGVFSRDGRLLFTTENDYENERGVIGVWDAADGYRRLAEFDSHGIGPHDLRLMPDGNTLVVANGGIATHPDSGRRKLNIAEMEPSLALIDVRSRGLVERCQLSRSLHKLSIRHLAVSKAGKIAAALQYEGPEEDLPPLLFTWNGGAPKPHQAPPDVQMAMRNYCGAIALDVSSQVIAVSCPRGNLVTFWDAATGRYLHSLSLEDGCGVAPTGTGSEFLVTSGAGTRVRYNSARRVARPLPDTYDTAWDNHVAAG